MATIELGGRRLGVTLVDDDVPAEVLAASWHADRQGYARALFAGRVQHLHRVLLCAQLSPGLVVDHINGDKLDNRRANLRVCRQCENARNVPRKRNNTSGIVGVSWDRTRQKWFANIKLNRKFINLGWHSTIERAAEARAAGERKYFGEFAHGIDRANPRTEIVIEPLHALQESLL